jgi:hypothetical protein
MDLGEKQNTIIKDEKKSKFKNASNTSVKMGTLAQARQHPK